MNILVAFGSTEGHTRKIAYYIVNRIEKLGGKAESHDCGGFEKKPDLNKFDAIIIAGSVHQAAHQPAIVEFVSKHLSVLNTKPSAFVSVSLSATLEDGLKEAKRYVSDFVNETDWQPDNIHMAGGAIRFLEYDFFKRFTIEHVVLKGNEMPDASSGNPEYTDWKALDAFVDGFIKTRDK